MVESGFVDIKRALGVLTKDDLVDIVGKGKYGGAGYVRNDMVIRFDMEGRTGARAFVTFKPDRFNEEIEFTKSNMLSRKFFDRLGLSFTECPVVDTVRGKTSPEGGRMFVIEYRGCAVVEKRGHEDVTKYFYRLSIAEGGKHADGTPASFSMAQLALLKDPY